MVATRWAGLGPCMRCSSDSADGLALGVGSAPS